MTTTRTRKKPATKKAAPARKAQASRARAKSPERSKSTPRKPTPLQVVKGGEQPPMAPSFPFRYILSETTFTVWVKGGVYSIARGSKAWDEVVGLVKANAQVSEEKMLELVNPGQWAASKVEKLNPKGSQGLRVVGKRIYYNDEPVENDMTRRLVRLLAEGFDTEAFVNFADKAHQNPWEGAREELWPWMVKSGMPIDPDGFIYGYKRVNADYTDCYSSSILNEVGNTISMKRERVDPNRRLECSTGFHICSLEYLGSFHRGKPILLVKVNPKDVVAVPFNESGKMRVSRYTIVDELTEAEVQAAKWPSVVEHQEVQASDIKPERRASRKAKKAGVIKGKKGAQVKPATPPDKTTRKLVVINSPEHGRITKTRFRALVKEHGSLAATARALGISQGTIQAWKTKLGL